MNPQLCKGQRLYMCLMCVYIVLGINHVGMFPNDNKYLEVPCKSNIKKAAEYYVEAHPASLDSSLIKF